MLVHHGLPKMINDNVAAAHDEQNTSLSSTWKGYFPFCLSQLNLAEGMILSFQLKKQRAFTLQNYPQGMFVSYLKEATFCCQNNDA